MGRRKDQPVSRRDVRHALHEYAGALSATPPGPSIAYTAAGAGEALAKFAAVRADPTRVPAAILAELRIDPALLHVVFDDQPLPFVRPECCVVVVGHFVATIHWLGHVAAVGRHSS